MSQLLEFLTDYTLRNVLLGSAVLGLVTGVMGSFALLKKQSLLGDAMSHAALPGVALVFIITGLKTPLALLIGAFISAWLGALLVMLVVRATRIKEDSGLGIVLAVFFGIGLALLSWIQQNRGANQSGLDKYLFGRAAAIVEQDVIVMSMVGGLALLLVILFWKEFKLLTFDQDFAAVQGFPVRLLHGLLTTLIVVGVVVGLQVVGVVLMAALVVAPAAAARQWTERLGAMVILSGLFGALAGSSGAMISAMASGLSTGPLIVIVASGIALFSLLCAPQRGLIPAALRQARNRRRLGTARVLEALYEMAKGHADPAHPHSLRSIEAALPFLNVGEALRELESTGLVHRVAADVYALTEAGASHSRDLFNGSAVLRVPVGEARP